MVKVAAREVRVPRDAREAVERRDAVTVLAHDRPTLVMLHPADYELVRGFLERRRTGRPVPVHMLLTEDDLAIMAEDRQDDDALALGISEAWQA